MHTALSPAQELLDQRLQQRQARETGICPVREELYAQTFGETRNAQRGAAQRSATQRSATQRNAGQHNATQCEATQGGMLATGNAM
jgi:hypothetical protein